MGFDIRCLSSSLSPSNSNPGEVDIDELRYDNCYHANQAGPANKLPNQEYTNYQAKRASNDIMRVPDSGVKLVNIQLNVNHERF